MYLRRFQVQGFKNFRRPVALEDLGPFNVIHGDNNAGKSNLIEAIGLFFLLIEELFEVPPPVAPQAVRPEIDRMLRSLLERYEQTADEDRRARSWQRRREVDRRVFERRGHPAREIFHLHEPVPIELSGSIGLAPGELERAGLQVPGEIAQGEIERIDVTLRLSTVVNALEVELVSLAFGAAGAAGATVLVTLDGVTPEQEAFLRRLGAFLSSRHDAEGNPTGRRFALVEADRWIEGARIDWPHAGRDMVPPDLCLALYDAKESRDDTQRQRWRRFVEAMQRFEEVLGPGEMGVVYDRHSNRASLVFETAAGRLVPGHLLGTGIQQVASLVGRMIMTGATLLAVEEPELNLRYTRQILLRELMAELVGVGEAPAQLFITSHSAAFESPLGFHALRSTADGPVLDRRPSSEAGRFIGTENVLVPPAGSSAPLCYVSSEGLVLVPEEVRQRLGIHGGGGVYFIRRKDTGHFEMLTDEQFLALLDDPDREQP